MSRSVVLVFLIAQCSAQCPCQNSGSCVDDKCACPTGWTGLHCQRPCVDFYKSCDVWNSEGRCQWPRRISAFFLENCPVTCNQCGFDPTTVPKGLPLPPVLEPIKDLVGVWQTETTFPDRYPVKFNSAGGYMETIIVSVAEVPGFDTPSLNYTVIAEKLDDPLDSQSELGFIYIKPGNSSERPVGCMITTNSGLIVIQEGTFANNVIHFNTNTYSQAYSLASNPSSQDLESERTLDFATPNRMVQTVRGQNGQSYDKLYKKIQIND